MKKSVDIFLGYAAEDKELCFEVMKQLKWLVRDGLIQVWHEYTINPGIERESEILRYLAMAHIILLFISADFIDSNFCYSVELRQAMERHERGEVRVIPIILRSVYWQETPLGKLQALPRGYKPIKSWSDRDPILAEIEEDVRIIVKELVSEKYLQEGRSFFEQKNFAQTIEDCEHALHLVPDSVSAYRLKGLALLELKQYNDALQTYDQVIHLGLNIASVYKERGDAFYDLHRYNDALLSYKEAIFLKPDFIAAYKRASEALRQLAQENNQLADTYEKKTRELLHSVENNTQEVFRWNL